MNAPQKNSPLEVLRSIAGIRLDGEPDEEGQDSEMEIDDAYRLLSDCVESARGVLEFSLHRFPIGTEFVPVGKARKLHKVVGHRVTLDVTTGELARLARRLALTVASEYPKGDPAVADAVAVREILVRLGVWPADENVEGLAQ